jgi:hypothetical protein
MHPVLAFIAAGGLGLLLGFVLAPLACARGFLFSGVDSLMAMLASAGACALAACITLGVFRCLRRRFGWLALTLVVLVVAPATVGLMSWFQTGESLEMFMKPAPVPQGLRVYHGRSTLFSSFVHFTGPPEAIASVLAAKGLAEIPPELPEGPDSAGFWERERFAKPWNWWQPAAMSSPRFFFRQYPGAAQGWTVGWWVNGATNEVYAYISG